MKTLDADSLYTGVNEVSLKLSGLKDQLKQIQSAIQGIISMEESLKGKGGTSIRAFYKDCHEPFLTFCSSFLTNYESALKDLLNALQSLDAAPEAFIRQSFLENELKNGLEKAKDNTVELTQDANQSMQSVNDIVFLPRLNEVDFVQQVEVAKRNTDQTIEKLLQFDALQTNALSTIEQQILQMNQYIEQIRSMFQNGQLEVASYKPGQLWKRNESEVDGTDITPEESIVKKSANNEQLDWWEFELSGDDPRVTLDLSAPVNSYGNAFGTFAEGGAFIKTAHNTKVKGFGIKKDVDSFRVNNGKVENIKGKKYHKNWIESQIKRGNTPEIAKHVRPGSAVKFAMKSRLGWVGTGITTTQNISENIENGESQAKILGDAGVDIGVGAVSLSTGAFVMGLVVASGGTALIAAGIGFGASNIVTYLFDGIEKDGESASDKVKKGVQKGIKTVASWFK